MRQIALLVPLIASLILASSPAIAQEIVITGPLTGMPPEIHYLPFALRGDVLFGGTVGAAATTGHDVSGAAGVGGALRLRRSGSFAWELDAGVLRGVEDASELRVPITLRAVFIDARAKRPDWELYCGVGPSFERITGDVKRGSLLGGEVGIGVDRRVDPIFNRFVVELVLSERRGIDGLEGWSTAAMLRIGIATTFGFRQTETR